MGNQAPKRKNNLSDVGDSYWNCFRIGRTREAEYKNSKTVPVRDLSYSDRVRRGDILCRGLATSLNSQSSNKQSTTKAGIFSHYAVYDQYIGGYHYVIEKTTPDDNGHTIFRNSISDRVFNEFWSLVVDCRYEDTYEMAVCLFKNREIDAGYDFSLSNCEHFVTFCLTRHARCTTSFQIGVVATVREVGAVFGVGIGQIGKIISHPFYLLGGGDMELYQRCNKTALPWGLNDEAVIRYQKILIGAPIRPSPRSWCPHDKKPSKDWLLASIRLFSLLPATSDSKPIIASDESEKKDTVIVRREFDNLRQ